MRTSGDVFDSQGVLLHGYDYQNQSWVENGRYVNCGHPVGMMCRCFGRAHEGEPVRRLRVVRVAPSWIQRVDE